MKKNLKYFIYKQWKKKLNEKQNLNMKLIQKYKFFFNDCESAHKKPC